MQPQGLVKGAIVCFRNPYFYFRHGESTSTAIQLTSPASKKEGFKQSFAPFTRPWSNTLSSLEGGNGKDKIYHFSTHLCSLPVYLVLIVMDV